MSEAKLYAETPCEHGNLAGHCNLHRVCAVSWESWNVDQHPEHCPGGGRRLIEIDGLIRQFAFDIVMTEWGGDEGDTDDQMYASEVVDKWMEHWRKTGGAALGLVNP